MIINKYPIDYQTLLKIQNKLKYDNKKMKGIYYYTTSHVMANSHNVYNPLNAKYIIIEGYYVFESNNILTRIKYHSITWGNALKSYKNISNSNNIYLLASTLNKNIEDLINETSFVRNNGLFITHTILFNIARHLTELKDITSLYSINSTSKRSYSTSLIQQFIRNRYLPNKSDFLTTANVPPSHSRLTLFTKTLPNKCEMGLFKLGLVLFRDDFIDDVGNPTEFHKLFQNDSLVNLLIKNTSSFISMIYMSITMITPASTISVNYSTKTSGYLRVRAVPFEPELKEDTLDILLDMTKRTNTSVHTRTLFNIKKINSSGSWLFSTPIHPNFRSDSYLDRLERLKLFECTRLTNYRKVLDSKRDGGYEIDFGHGIDGKSKSQFEIINHEIVNTLILTRDKIAISVFEFSYKLSFEEQPIKKLKIYLSTNELVKGTSILPRLKSENFKAKILRHINHTIVGECRGFEFTYGDVKTKTIIEYVHLIKCLRSVIFKFGINGSVWDCNF